MKSISELKRDYIFILQPILEMSDKGEALKRLTTLRSCIEDDMTLSKAKIEVVKECRRKVNQEILAEIL